MLYTKDLEDVILYAPALITGSACSSLKIISGFTDCERISSHLISLLDGIKEKKYVSNIKISLILGMTKGSSLTKKKHKKICQTIKRVQTMRGMPKIPADILPVDKKFILKCICGAKETLQKQHFADQQITQSMHSSVAESV